VQVEITGEVRQLVHRGIMHKPCVAGVPDGTKALGPGRRFCGACVGEFKGDGLATLYEEVYLPRPGFPVDS
jgi:hypothetical protein